MQNRAEAEGPMGVVLGERGGEVREGARRRQRAGVNEASSGELELTQTQMKKKQHR